jgi:hypothetical protein
VVAWTWIQHHRWLSVLFLAVVVIGTAGGTCWAVFFRTVASPVSLRDALRTYRRDQVAATGALGPGGRIQPMLSGVFRYRTTGGEGLSLLGVSRSFPTKTDMVVTNAVDGCNVVDWLPIVEHTESTTLCPGIDHSLTATSFVTHEQISGTTTTTVVDCPSTTYVVPPIAAVGVQWSATCHQVSPAEPVVVHGLVVAGGPLDVGGQSVPTVHVRLTLSFSGIESGTAPTDLWISTTRGLVVREQELASVTQAGVHYREKMSTELTSLAPAG